MSNKTISITKEFTPFAGVRYIEDESSKGQANSGERFRKQILEPALKEVMSQNGTLTIDFDGIRSMGPSFIDEVFGVLIGQWKLEDKDVQKLRKTILIKSESVVAFKKFAEERMDYWQNLSKSDIESEFKKITTDRMLRK